MADNEELKAIAIKVLEKSQIPKDDRYGFAIVTILMIISIILTCVRILQECNKNKLSTDCTAQEKNVLYGEQLKLFSRKRGWFTKMRIKRVLRRELSPSDYNQYSMSLLSSLLDIGANLTDEEINTLVEAANV